MGYILMNNLDEDKKNKNVVYKVTCNTCGAY